jgi:NADH/NAD ratio-sensing transcriptional regulator Rex
MKKVSKAAEVKVGVVGYGGAFNMGKAHLAEMKRAGMTPVAVVEIDPKRLEVARQDFPGIETYSSVAAMLKRSDVNLVTTTIPNPPGEGWKYYQNVADHLTKGTKLVIPAEWARRPIHIIDLACQSAKVGHALKPKYK